MTEVRFIHTSDVHLGHRQFNLDERFSDFSRAFAGVVDAALEHNVDFILIGGDFFHKRAIDAETLAEAVSLLTRLRERGIPVVAVEGNHDKAFYQDKSSWLHFLNRQGYLYLLKPVYEEGRVTLKEWDDSARVGNIMALKNVRLVGLGYLGATTAQRLTELAELLPPAEIPTVMLLHAAVDKLLGQDLGGIKKEVLDAYRDKVDYLALGHIHGRQEIDTWIYNPGSLECCHIDESGQEKGCYLVALTGKAKEVRYLPSRPRPVKRLTLDITDCPEPAEVHNRVLAALAAENITAQPEQPLLQLTLYGTIEFSALAIDTSALAAEIKEIYKCLYVEVVNNVNLPAIAGISAGEEILSRLDVERRVLKEMVEHHRPEWREYSDSVVNLVLQVKNAVLAGVDATDLINGVNLVADELGLAAAAAAREQADAAATAANEAASAPYTEPADDTTDDATGGESHED